MVSDIIIISIVSLFVFIGYKRGLAATVLNIAAVIISALLAWYSSPILSQWLYNSSVKPVFVENLGRIINSNGVIFAAENCIHALPEWLSNIVSPIFSLVGFDFSRILPSNDYLLNISLENAVVAIESRVGELLIDIISFILLLLLFLVIYLLLKQVVKFVLNFFNIPVLREINSILGGVLGGLEGMVFAFVAVNLFYVLAVFANPDLVNNEISGGQLYELFCIIRR